MTEMQYAEMQLAQTFWIGIVDSNESRLGKIVMGTFWEHFELNLEWWTGAEYERHWRGTLLDILNDVRARVVLTTWASPPDITATRRAWRFHRHDDVIRVQENLYVPGCRPYEVDRRGAVVDSTDMDTTSEEGTPISEWRVTLDAIRRFLRSPT